MPPRSSHSIDAVSRITGIEAARLRFLELEFKGLFHSGAALQTAAFAEWEIELLEKLNDLLFRQGESLSDVHERFSRKTGRPQILAMTSGKGGVGKTTISVNLAISLSRQGLHTLLIDADMGLGNVHVFGGITPRGNVLDVLDGKAPIGELLSDGPAGLKVLCGCSGSARLASLPGPMLDRLTREITAIAASFDVVLIDTGAGIAEQVTKFLAMADDIIVVSTPNIASTLDAYGVVKVCREADMRGRIHLIVNQAEGHSEAQAVSDKIGQCAVRFLGHTVSNLGWLPRDRAFEEANQARRPIAAFAPDSSEGRLILSFAQALRSQHASPETDGGRAKKESPRPSAAWNSATSLSPAYVPAQRPAPLPSPHEYPAQRQLG